MFKNVSGQKITLQAIDVSTGLPKTGDAANITFSVSKDNGAPADLADTSVSQVDATKAPGDYVADVSQTESNADTLRFTGRSSTTNVVIIPQTFCTAPANFTTQSIDGSGRVDIGKLLGATTALTNLSNAYASFETGTAQAGGASTITLRSGASSSNDFYNDQVIFILSGTGAGQTNRITDYVGSTKVATVGTAWITQPDNTSVYIVLGRVG